MMIDNRATVKGFIMDINRIEGGINRTLEGKNRDLEEISRSGGRKNILSGVFIPSGRP